MQAIPVEVRRATTTTAASATPDLEADLARARVLANWLDAKFSFMGVRFGMDAVIGLVPVIGDTLSALAAMYPLWVAQRHGLGKVVQTRMAWNVFLDWLPGLVPFVGDAFDVAFKANLKNLKLLEEAAGRKRRREAIR